MKHKTLAVLCAVVLTAGMMTGCGQKTEDTKTESGSEKTVSDEMAENDLKNYIAKDGTIKAHVQAADANEDHYMPVFTVSGGEEND